MIRRCAGPSSMAWPMRLDRGSRVSSRRSFALEPLYASLSRDPDPAVRIGLAGFLATQGDTRSVRRALGDMLCSSKGKVRLAVLEAIEMLPDHSFVPRRSCWRS